MPGGCKNINGTDGKLFVKGDSRINKIGRPKKLDLDNLLREVLMSRVHDQQALRGILLKLRDMALTGDMRAAEILLDRYFGKVRAPIDGARPSFIVGIQYIVPEGGNSNKANADATFSVRSVEV
jgi:hypothetical protein